MKNAQARRADYQLVACQQPFRCVGLCAIIEISTPGKPSLIIRILANGKAVFIA